MQHTSFEYFSTFAPVSDTLLDDEPSTTISSAELDQASIASLLFVDRGYKIFDDNNAQQQSKTLKAHR